MIGVGFGEELDTEIVNGEGEGRGTVVVPPEAGGGADGVVAVRGEVGTELVVGEDGGFFEAVHAFLDFKIGVVFGIEVLVGKVVFGNIFMWNVAAVDAPILADFLGGGKDKVIDVGIAVVGTMFFVSI